MVRARNTLGIRDGLMKMVATDRRLMRQEISRRALAMVTAEGRAATTTGTAMGVGATGAPCPQRAQVVRPGSRTAAQ